MRLVNPLVRSPEVPTPPDERRPGLSRGRRWSREQLLVNVAIGAVLAVAVWLRFWTPSPLWLDEALTVNLAAKPLHELPALLRHDGAPPLFYVLLHGWMKLFGTGDLAVRSLSGLIGVATLPVAWLAAYRVGARAWRTPSTAPAAPTGELPTGEVAPEVVDLDRQGRIVAWTTVVLLATSPFAVYYDTEARMYSLVMLLTALGLLAYTYVLRRPTRWNAAALAACTGGLLYTHYWALYLVAVTGAASLWCAWRGPYRPSCRAASLAIAVGCLSFVPWLPSFLFQIRHTGTPWAAPADFTALVYTFTQLAGGNSDAGRALALLFGFLILLAITGSALDARRVVIDLRTRPGVRGLALVAAGTLVIAVVAGKLSGSTFADRYSAVVTVPALVVVAYGVTALAGRRVRQVVVAAAVALGLAASIPNAFITRTQAGQVASAILARVRSGDVIAYCPDQLGPAVSRILGGRFDEVAFPRANRPEIVNWVDYTSTVEHASTTSFVHLLEHRAGSHAIWYVWAPGYLGYGADCQMIANQLAASRPQQAVVAELPPDTPFEIFEGESLYRYRSR